MEFELRHMEKGDISQIMAIENVSFPTPWAEHAFLSELKNRYAVYFVALHEGRVVGYAGMWLFSGEAHITTVGVHPDFRRRGLGEMFVNKLINHARSQGASTMVLEVRPSNTSARRLYKKMGFRQIGCRKNYYLETHEDALVMIKDIFPEDTPSGCPLLSPEAHG